MLVERQRVVQRRRSHPIAEREIGGVAGGPWIDQQRQSANRERERQRVGMRVTATAELVKIDGRTLGFRVEAHDERELIGDGLHERVIVNVERFDQRVQKKLSPS